MKKLLPWLLLLIILLGGCAPGLIRPAKKQYTATFLTLFDTVTSIAGFAESEDAFQAKAQEIHDALMEYHRLFDIYTSYDGLVNLRTVNDLAASAPVRVDSRIIALLKDCKRFYDQTGGSVNAAMGSVLSLWHDAREGSLNDPSNAYIPGESALREAAAHTNFDSVIIDEAASTVFFADPGLKLDVGAIAKGWSVQRVAEKAPEGMLISVGGNVCATGSKDEGGTPWIIGIQNPDGEDYLHTVYLTKGSVVTSGDYQRAYSVNGRSYHHIIDPETLHPAAYWRSVTVICADSGAADALSTALFVLPRDEGQALLEAFVAEAMWMDAQGSISCSPGFEKLIRS